MSYRPDGWEYIKSKVLSDLYFYIEPPNVDVLIEAIADAILDALPKLCKVELFLDKQGNSQWRDYVGNIYPIAVFGKEGDKGHLVFIPEDE